MAQLSKIWEFILGMWDKVKGLWTALQSHFPWIQENYIDLILGLLGLWVMIRVGPWFVRQAYDFYESHKRVVIQITMPREESQKDKENATEKDFREKMGVMEQLYRAIHEIHELNLWNQIMVKCFARDSITFEIFAKHKDITFFCTIHPYYKDVLEKQITSFYPTAEIAYIASSTLKAEEGKKHLTKKGYYLYTKNTNWLPLKTYKTIENDPLNDLTNVLSQLKENEKAMLQMMIRPRDEKWQKEANAYATAKFKNEEPQKRGILRTLVRPLSWLFTAMIFGYDQAEKNSPPPGAKSGDSYVRMLQTEEEIAKRIGEKSNQVGFDTVIRIMAASDEGESRCDSILDGLFVAFNTTKDAASNWFQARRLIPIDFINSPILYMSLIDRNFQFGEKSSILTPEELATIFHFPNSRYNYTPLIKWMSYKVLPAPTEMGTDGIFLGYNVFRGVKKPVHFRKKDRARHHYIIGQTGTGKSSYISQMARQDIANGDGVCVIDPHGDLIEDILQYIPKERAKDVIVFDPADSERPMGLNMLEAKTPEQQDMASSQATEIFIKIFGDEIFGPRIQHYFRNACLTLMEDPDEGATLIDVPRIFVDEQFMRYKVSKVKNPVVKSFWDHEYANTGDRERQEMIPYFSAKFGPFITNSIMRNTIGQAKSAFNIRECMDQQKILLVNLSKGKLGTLNTQLLGLVLVAQIQMAAMSRVDTPEEQRKDFYLYVDEFQNFATDTFCSILSEARKYKLVLIMAHQYIGQLTVTKGGSTSTQIRDAVFGNVGTMQSFKVGADDAEYLSKEYAPVLTEQDVIGIANYKAYMKMNLNNTASRPFSLETVFDESQKNEKVRQVIKEYSRMKYGRKRSFVEQEIAARIGVNVEELGKDVKADYTATAPQAAAAEEPLHQPITSPTQNAGS
ncbi:type IV secretion system DNA-binding domain-containing protein [Candidatus Peregrinibacteria bacterium]|nr:MAG: type IV secretion system DNA-binding domain-containing protein [Candidatus Peregrinibacteria bacterium]